ncbi:ATP-binding protein [Marinobacterium sedimentorum]|uniref:ATP-binding protein n=1 Tax=Marinobacterium sedimentorum TaxID=2927804 RepID=UPI0020C747E3|nr:ATP-binding protein [Marinobacterium sedimentorum]MCP8688390.1 ATP-binding protein [Marinobacterium sedimentorum]
MRVGAIPGLKRLGIGGRLFLAFVLISSITVLASGLATNTYLDLSARLLALKEQDIPGLDAAARLNNTSRLVVATAPLLVTSDSNLARQQAMDELRGAILDMDQLMRNLPDYNRYFSELIVQIENSLVLLNQSVERREQIRRELALESNRVFPLFSQFIHRLEASQHVLSGGALGAVISRLYYFSGMVEKVRNDASFNDLDYTFLRLELLGAEIRQQLQGIAADTIQPELIDDLHELLRIGSRAGALFALKNEELDLLYQQSFFLENSQQHIHQLATQINHHTNQTNASISDSLQAAIVSINVSIRSILLLSLISLMVACAISWFYVRRNVLQRIIELQQNMRAIASAQLDTPIRILGDDEVSAMARDLKHFQKTAIEVERTNQRLAAEIDERITAEAQLKAAQNELIQAGKLAALGQLSVGITHEINQPLTAIASHLHSAGRRLDRQQPEQARLSLNKIRQLLDKIASITRHLKAFAREAGTELSPVDLDGVIRESLELMSARLADVDCELCYEPGPAGLKVEAEPIRLEQVLVNLLSNAIDAMKGSEVRSLNIRVGQAADAVMVEVQDSGIGIAADQLGQIFDPFFTGKEVGEGLGLGLSISYNIVQDFGGHIRVQSRQGHGSTFILVLKRAEQHA